MIAVNIFMLIIKHNISNASFPLPLQKKTLSPMHGKMLRKHALARRFDFHKYKANTKAQTAISHKKLMLRDVY